MPRPPGVQIIRNPRKDGSVTFGLRVRTGGDDEVVSLGNSGNGWDEVRVEAARKQLLAKIELGLWTPGIDGASGDADEEPTFRELATDWLEDRKRNPAIRSRTTELNESQLTRYLLPFFGPLRPSKITSQTIKEYRRRIHEENAQIRAAEGSGNALVDPRNGRRLRTLGNESINKTLRTLAQILDEAEDATWIDRNPARGKRTREPLERRRRSGALDLDEFLSLLDAATQVYRAQFEPGAMDQPAFPTLTGTRRSKDNLRLRVVNTVVARANQLRISRKQTPIHLHVTPHTFRRTYITYMLAAGHDIPYVQSQVGHRDPTVTLSVYAQRIRRPDREQLRQELHSFLETPLPRWTCLPDRQSRRQIGRIKVGCRPPRSRRSGESKRQEKT